MSAVYLLRHGQASFGAEDYDVLSPTGELQAKVLGEELRHRGVRADQVWSGSLRRQRDTAAATLAEAGIAVPCRTDERWNEYDHLALVNHLLAGVAPGDRPASSREFQQVLDRALHQWIADGTDSGAAGTFAAFAQRSAAALDDLVAGLGKGATALVFTSGGVITAICARLLGVPPAGFLALNRVVVNAAVTKIVHGRSGTSLVSFNEHSHFEGENRELLSYR